MTVNGLKLPESFVELIDRPVPEDYWIPKGGEEGVDAYGHQLGNDLWLFDTLAEIEKETNGLPDYFHVASLTPQTIEKWHVANMQRRGFIPYITDFSRIVRFGRTPSGESYCFDFRENPDKPCIIYWDDGYWRGVAPDFDTLISLFKPFDIDEEPPPDDFISELGREPERSTPVGSTSRTTRTDLPRVVPHGDQGGASAIRSLGGELVSPAEANPIWRTVIEGHYSDALERWNSLIAQDSRPDRYRLARGTTLLLLGDLRAALADFLEARKSMGPARPLVPLVGTALWLQGQHEEACLDWAWEIAQNHAGHLAPADDASGVQVPALVWWASAHAGLERHRFLAIAEFRRQARSEGSERTTWPAPLRPFLLGMSSAEELLAAVPNPHPFRARWLCQAHFYIGAGSLSRSDMSQYQEQLTLAVAQGSDSIQEPEFHLAQAELRRLG
jgi:tetratricopeptide (TPR) repeat protein